MSDGSMIIVLRFYGRFLFVRSATSQSGRTELTVIAVNMTYNKEVNNAPHNALMTIREANVSRKRQKGEPPELPPMYRIIPSNVAPYDGARLIWDIAQCQIDIVGNNGLTWTPGLSDVLVADLNEISDKQLDKRWLHDVGPGSVATSIIRVHDGVATPFQKLDNQFRKTEYTYVSQAQPNSHSPAGALADMVQVVLTVPNRVHFAVNEGESTIGVAGTSFLNAMRLFGDPAPRDVVVCFSSLCTRPDFVPGDPDFGVDRGFAAFCETLIGPPTIRECKTPVFASASSRLPPQRRLESRQEMSRPFGDCYASATIRANA